MVSLGAVATLEWGASEPVLERHNGLPSVKLASEVTRGNSTGTAMATLESLAAKLGRNFDIRWTGQSYEERKSGAQAPWLFALSLLFIFLCLVALYESWSLPLTVLLTVPTGMIGAVAIVGLFGMPNDVYFKVGMVVIMGLAAKNAILVVEYAEQLRAQGMGVADAVLRAAGQRFRPVVMTSLAFMLGVVPLVISTGPGAAAQRSVGTGVLGGMIGATLFGTLVVPLLYAVVVRRRVVVVEESKTNEGQVPLD
jgi:multidrug efflux pump